MYTVQKLCSLCGLCCDLFGSGTNEFSALSKVDAVLNYLSIMA
jgi:hypothetical protein